MASLLLGSLSGVLRGAFQGAAIGGVVEHVEAQFGDAIEERDEAVAHCSREGGLGPPDLCWLRKAQADGRGSPEGAFHWASVAAYLAQLVNGVEEPRGALGRLLGAAPRTAIQGAIYCCYDALARCDVRCELSLPGGLACYALDGVGEQRQLVGAEEEAAWVRCRVSSALRSLRFCAATALRAGALRVIAPPACLASPAAEAALLADVLALRRAPDAASAAAALASRGPGVLPEGARHWVRSTPEDVLLNTLLRHLLAQRRAAAAVTFLRAAAAAAEAEAPSAEADAAAAALQAAPPAPRGAPPPAAASLAVALLAQGEAAEARRVTAAALELRPSDPALLLLLADCEDAAADAPAASAAAARACATAPEARAVWLRLAAALASQGRHADALVALNCAPFVGVAEEHAADPWRGYFPSGRPPLPARRTQPRRPAAPDAATEAELAAWDEAGLSGRAGLAALPGAQLLPPPEALPYAVGYAPTGPPLTPAAVSAAMAYSVLVDIVTALGWEGLLEVRSTVFVMDDAPEEDGSDDDAGEQHDTSAAAVAAAAAAEKGDAAGADAAPQGGNGEAAAAAATAALARRAGTRDAGVRAPGAPLTGVTPQRTPKRPDAADGHADDAGAAAQAAAPATAPHASSPTASSTSAARGEADVARDRAALAAGAPLAPRRLCAEWLDVLISALYDDVAEYTAWRAAEAADARDARREAELATAAAAGDPAVMQAALAAAEAEAAEDAAVDRDAALGTAGDWARRGALCERLKRCDDAERAYRVCVHLGFHAGAWRALARIYAAWGWAPEALTAAAQLAAAATHSGGDARGAVAPALRRLIASVGLQAARSAQEGLGPAPEAVNDAFHDAVRWKSEGWDK